MTDVNVGAFNVNQFSKPAHELADLVVRMADTDVLLLQETVNVDLVAFVQSQPGWVAFQIRHGDSDGHANTAVLHRTTRSLPGPRVTDEVLLADTAGERRRFLAAELLDFGWAASAHINPKRFSADIPEQLRHLGDWVEAHPGPVVIGLDKNQCPVADLEHATGLTWHGIGIDGFLTNLPLKALAEFPKGFSDHPGVHAAVTPPTTTVPEVPPVTAPKPHRLADLIAAIRAALGWANRHGKTGNAAKERAALKALRKKKPAPKPKVVPAPRPYALTKRDGHTIDELTNYALYAVEKRLKFTPGSLTVVQGSYNGGTGAVSASAGTHDGGGVVDLTAVGWEDKVRALRAVGFAAWHRPFNWDNAGGGEHIHAVLIGNVKLSPSAARQVVQYRNHTNGLANFGADNTWHPNPIPTFHMPTTAQEI